MDRFLNIINNQLVNRLLRKLYFKSKYLKSLLKYFLMQFLRKTQFVLYGMKHYIKRDKPFNRLEGTLAKKHVIVTGATAGLGLGLAKDFAKRGAIVHMVCRNIKKGEEIKNQVVKQTNNTNIYVHACDIGSMREIKQFATKFEAEYGTVDILVNNAGAMINTYSETPQGFQSNFAANTMGTYYLTKLLLPSLRKAATVNNFAKVIIVSSGGMLTQNLEVEDYFLKKNFDGTKQYAINKRQQVALTQYFAQKNIKENIFFYSMHPGWVDTDGVRTSMPDFHKRFEKDLRQIQEGIDTIVYLSLTDDKKLKVGQFYFDRQIQDKHLSISLTKYKTSEVEKLVKDLEKFIEKALSK